MALNNSFAVFIFVHQLEVYRTKEKVCGETISLRSATFPFLVGTFSLGYTGTPSVVLLLSSSFKGMLSHLLVHLDLPVYE